MPWRRSGDKPLNDPIMTQFSDAYMRDPASMSLVPPWAGSLADPY